ncbi:MAG: tetratricopeptide repeat protein [bacterium]
MKNTNTPIMASIAIKLGLAVRQVDAALSVEALGYPAKLPANHSATLSGWRCRLRSDGGTLLVYTQDEFDRLTPLQKHLEAYRAQAEALLAHSKAGGTQLADIELAFLTQRALGILPGNEGDRFLELATATEFSPHYLTSTPERFLRGMADVEAEMGLATALGYGCLLMAGVRPHEDLLKYGDRIEELFEAVTETDAATDILEMMGAGGIHSLRHEQKAKLLKVVRDALWRRSSQRQGRSFLLTQVVDGYLGLRPGGTGDDLGLSICDAIVAAKLGLEVHFIEVKGAVMLEIGGTGGPIAVWDPYNRNAELHSGPARRLATADVFTLGYTRMARGYANYKQFANGARVAQWVLGMRPNLAEAHQILGQCLLGDNKPREAIETCGRALQLDPKMADAFLVQGNAYSVMNRWPEAVEHYRKAIDRRPGYSEAFNNLGLALQRSGELSKAVGAYREAVRTRPDYVEALYNLGNLYLERSQYEPDPRRGIGDPATELQHAVDAYRDAVKLAPNFAGAWYNLGQAYYGRKEMSQALSAYNSAVKANPKHAGAWHNMGIVYRDLGQPDKAVEAIEKAVTLNPILLR